MYYIIGTDYGVTYGIRDANFENWDLYSKTEYAFTRNSKPCFIIPISDVTFITGIEDEEEYRTCLIKLEKGDSVVYSF